MLRPTIPLLHHVIGLFPQCPAALGRVADGLIRIGESLQAGQGFLEIPQIEVIQTQAKGQFPAVRIMLEPLEEQAIGLPEITGLLLQYSQSQIGAMIGRVREGSGKELLGRGRLFPNLFFLGEIPVAEGQTQAGKKIGMLSVEVLPVDELDFTGIGMNVFEKGRTKPAAVFQDLFLRKAEGPFRSAGSPRCV